MSRAEFLALHPAGTLVDIATAAEGRALSIRMHARYMSAVAKALGAPDAWIVDDDPREPMTEPLYPVTIIRTRYGGVYEGGAWAAFNCDEWDVPGDATGCDGECEAFWRDPKAVRVGVGGTPDQALDSLLRVVDDGAALVSGEKRARDPVARPVTGQMHVHTAPTTPEEKAAERARIIETAANVARARVEGIAAFARALQAGAAERTNEGT